MKRKLFGASRLLENDFFLLFSVYTVSFVLCFFLAWIKARNGALADAYLFAIPLIAMYLPFLFFSYSEEGRKISVGLQAVKQGCGVDVLLLSISALAFGTGGSLLYQSLSLPLLWHGMAIAKEFSVLSLVAVVAFGSFCEELLVRGAIQGHLTSLGTIRAVALSACFSAALCFSVSSFPFFLILGGLCAFARQRVGSVWGAFVASFAARLGFYLSHCGVWKGAVERIGGTLLSLLFLALALGSFCSVFFLKHRKQSVSQETFVGRKGSAALWLLAILFVGLSVGASFLIPTL
ncbi:MAG: CPBP family intramembrane metalloprotease [Clostridia bacterium]|nr:CPBP family intramembrane metalloprotease [Clostridia bacterium]